MRRAAKVDANQPAIVQAFESMGASVCHLHAVGQGCPDLLIAHRNLSGNILVEVKDGAKPPSARRLTPAQQQFHERWRGPIVVVETIEEAMSIIKHGAAIPPKEAQALVGQMNAHFRAHDNALGKENTPGMNVNKARASNDAGQGIKARLERAGVALVNDERGFFKIKETSE